VTNMNPYLAERIMKDSQTQRDRALRDHGNAGYPRHGLGNNPSAGGSERGLRLIRLGDWRIDLTLRRG
jgi:hypothetical protein